MAYKRVILKKLILPLIYYVFCLDVDVYDLEVYFQVYNIFLILMSDNKKICNFYLLCQVFFISWRDQKYKKKQTLFYAFNYLSFELYSITDDENEYETIFIFFVKI